MSIVIGHCHIILLTAHNTSFLVDSKIENQQIIKLATDNFKDQQLNGLNRKFAVWKIVLVKDYDKALKND